jgi:hypothetical protein
MVRLFGSSIYMIRQVAVCPSKANDGFGRVIIRCWDIEQWPNHRPLASNEQGHNAVYTCSGCLAHGVSILFTRCLCNRQGLRLRLTEVGYLGMVYRPAPVYMVPFV